jgi:hypothetical protein
LLMDIERAKHVAKGIWLTLDTVTDLKQHTEGELVVIASAARTLTAMLEHEAWKKRKAGA